MSDPILIFTAPDQNHEAIKDLREQIEKARKDPSYSILTSYPLSWLEIEAGNLVMGDRLRADQVQMLREEMSKALKDTTYIPIVPFDVATMHRPTFKV